MGTPESVQQFADAGANPGAGWAFRGRTDRAQPRRMVDEFQWIGRRMAVTVHPRRGWLARPDADGRPGFELPGAVGGVALFIFAGCGCPRRTAATDCRI